MQKFRFSNGITIESPEVLWMESNQQKIEFPGELNEVKRLLDGQPSSLMIRLRDGSTVEIKAGATRLGIQTIENG